MSTHTGVFAWASTRCFSEVENTWYNTPPLVFLSVQPSVPLWKYNSQGGSYKGDSPFRGRKNSSWIISLLSPIWFPSLNGSKRKQPEHSLQDFISIFYANPETCIKVWHLGLIWLYIILVFIAKPIKLWKSAISNIYLWLKKEGGTTKPKK